MVSIEILNKGDSVLTITDQFLAIRRKNGEVDIFNVMVNEANEFCIDPIKSAVIGFGSGIVGKTLDDGETTVYQF